MSRKPAPRVFPKLDFVRREASLNAWHAKNAWFSPSGFISFGTPPPGLYGEAGVFLGYDTAPKISLYADVSNYLKFDGALLTWSAANTSLDASGNLTATNATLSGTITATLGAIGGFSIGSDYMRDVANSFGLASTVTGGDDVRFWAGAAFADRATAPLRITEAGAVVASNLTVTGGAIDGAVLNAGSVTGTAIANATIGTAHIASAAITTALIADANITTAKVVDLAVTAAKIANATITATQITDATITGAKIAAATIAAANIVDATITGAKIANATIAAANLVDATITTAKIGNAQITTALIADLAVTNAKINDLAVGKLTAGTITAGSIYLGGANFLLDGTATLVTIQDSQAVPVTRVKLGKTGVGLTDYGLQVYDSSGNLIVDVGGLGVNVVGTNQLQALAVTAAKIANATITATQITDATITGAKIASATITGSNIAAITIAAGNIVAGTLTATQIADLTITAGKIANGAITATQIADATITAAKIVAGTITANEIANLTITAAKITDLTITAAKITDLTITGGKLAASTITADKISVTTLSAIQASTGALTVSDKLTMSGAASAIAIGTTPPTSATVGTGIWIDRTGVYGLNANTQEAYLRGSDGKIVAGAGAVTLGSGGISVAEGTGVFNQIKTVSGSVTIGQLYSVLDPGANSGLSLISIGKDATTHEAYLEIIAITDDGTAHLGAASVTLSLSTENDEIDLVADETWIYSNLVNLRSPAPKLCLQDSTALAKSLLLTVDADLAKFEEAGGAAANLLVLDLANGRVGVGTAPDTLFHVAGAGKFTGQLTSTLAIGTAPFAVTSTTVCVNLNADLLDGNEASAFLTLAAHTAIGDGSPHHAAITLAASADVLLGLSTQQLSLDNQNANVVLAGPATAPAAAPTFRALVSADIPALDHGAKLTGLSDDDHAQYGLLAGRSGGQYLYGGTAANDDLTLEGTSHATKTTSYVILQPNGGNVGIGTTEPSQLLEVSKSQDAVTYAQVTNANTGTLAQSILRLANSTTGLNLGYTSTGYTSVVTYDRQAGAYLESAGAGGLSLGAWNASGIITFNTGGNTEKVRIDNAGNVGIGTMGPDRLLHPEVADAVTAAVGYGLRLSHVTSGTAAAGFGVGVEFENENSTGSNVVSAYIENLLSTVGAGWLSDLVLKAADSGGAREFLRGRGSGSAAQLGVLGATPISRQAHIVDADGTLADLTSKFNTLLSYLENFGFIATS